MRICDCFNYLRVGMKVRTHASGLNNISDTVEGYIGEINESAFYIWQNKFNGNIGRLNPRIRGFTYSWLVYFENEEDIEILEVGWENKKTIKEYGISKFLKSISK